MTITERPDKLDLATLDDKPDGDIAFVTEQIEEERIAAQRDQRRARRAATMRPIMWRLHFLGGFLAGPIVLLLCVSGILYAWNPQIDAMRFGDIMHSAAPVTSPIPLAEQVDAAKTANPTWEVYAITPGSGRTNTKVTMDPPGGGRGFGGPSDAEYVYVDQSTGQVMGTIAKADTSNTLFRNMHSSLWLGEDFEPLTELAGAWFVASLLTGVYLWWPGLRRRGAVAFAKRRNLQGRRSDKEWHNAIGMLFLVPMLLLAATGLTWTQFSGDRVDLLKDQLAVPRNGAGVELASPVDGNQDLVGADITYAQALDRGLVHPIEIIVPRDESTAWKARSRDTTFPVERDQLTVDVSTGAVVDYFDYSDEHWFNKLRTAGILFHQAQLFGWPLQVGMTILTLGVAAMVVSGYRMWWARRPASGMGTPAPVRQWLRTAPISLMIGLAFLGWLMPTLGLSLMIWLIAEQGWRWRSGQLSSPISDGVKALLLAGFAVAMLVQPQPEGDADLSTLPRLAMWAWSRPLGIALLLVAVVGVRAIVAPRRSSTDVAVLATDDCI